MKINIQGELPPRGKVFKYLLVAMVLIASAAMVNAGSGSTIPHTFSPGTQLKSAECFYQAKRGPFIKRKEGHLELFCRILLNEKRAIY